MVAKIKATEYNFFFFPAAQKKKHNLKIVAPSVFQSGEHLHEHSWTRGISVNKAGSEIQ